MNKLLVIIDEAHHAPMPSYREVLKDLKKIIPGFKLLGLTATPTRMTEGERRVLNNIFQEKYIYNIPMSKLITQKYLSDPIFERVETNIRFEPEFEEKDKRFVAQFGELSERIKNSIATAKERNSIIIEHYIKNKERYGKTIIFAINKIHCESLNQELINRGVKSDYVMSGKQDNDEIIRKFRRDELEVLINIQILTEGVDIPNIKTVFLTRPTQSDVLLMQMIGRGLRGEEAKGTRETYIVDFHDQWDTFNAWLNPDFINDGQDGESGDETEKESLPPESGGKTIIQIPPDIIQSIYNTLNDPFIINQEIHNIIPVGWYYVENTIQTEENADFDDIRVMVFDNQLEGYQAIEENLKWIVSVKAATVKGIKDRFFRDIKEPLPLDRDLQLIFNYIRKYNSMPEYFAFAEREALNLTEIAKYIIKEDLRLSQINSHLQSIYDEKMIIGQVFNDFETFKSKVYKEIEGGEPGPDKPPNLENTVIIDHERSNLRKGPHHNLGQLYVDVVNEFFRGNLDMASEIHWTRKPVKSYYAIFRYGDRKIVMNSLLDSPDVPKEVIKYVIYHELLHADGMHYHNELFNKRWHKYPNWAELDRFLYTITEKYHIDVFKRNRRQRSAK